MSSKKYSGKFVLRIPSELHQIVEKKSKELGVSLNHFCKAKLEEALSGKKNEHSQGVQCLIQEWGENVVGLVLFGSVARGEQTPPSDLDLLIVLNSKIKLSRSLYKIWDLKSAEVFNKEFNSKVSPHFIHIPQDTMGAGGLWYEVSIDGIVLWEKNYLISRFLKRIRESILSGSIKRFMTHGHPYWVKYAK